MKKVIIFAAVAAMLGVEGMHSQSTGITAQGVNVERDGSRVNVKMDIDVKSLKGGRDTEYVITPKLVSADASDSVMLEPVVVAGRNKYYAHLRNNDLGQTAMYREGKAETIAYAGSAAAVAWVDNSRLALEVETRTCCESSSATQGVARLTKPVFVPEFNFVTPVGDSVKVGEIKRRAYVNFPVNKTELYPDYMNNPVELKKITNTIDSVKNDADITITAISIEGFASPEGSYANNVRLAKGRTATLTDYVEKLYQFGKGFIATSYEAEDWAGLREYIEKSAIFNRDAIIAVIDSDLEPDAKDRKLKTDFPTDYAYILANIYPWLRHSDYRIEYRIRSFTTIDEIMKVMATEPTKLNVGEFYRAAQSQPAGSKAYNDIIEMAVRYNPTNETANLNAANVAMSRGEYQSAENYLAKAGNGAEAEYARGVLSAMRGEYGAAERQLSAAAKGKVADAVKALEAVRQLAGARNGFVITAE